MSKTYKDFDNVLDYVEHLKEELDKRIEELNLVD